MTPTREAELVNLLSVACSLLEIEAATYRNGHSTNPEQRKRIAITLEAFAAKGRKAVGDRDDAAAQTKSA